MREDLIVVNLNDTELMDGIRQVNSHERKIRCQFLVYLAEVEKRALHVELGYSSLCSFLMKELGHLRIRSTEENPGCKKGQKVSRTLLGAPRWENLPHRRFQALPLPDRE